MLFHHFLMLLLLVSPACAEKKTTETFIHLLGENNLKIERTLYAGSSPLFIVHVHDNEQTAAAAAKAFLKNAGGTFLAIRNGGERLINFGVAKQIFTADPNRIYTENGRKNTLEKLSRYHPKAEAELEGLADFFLEKLAEQNTVVAVHNNTNGAYSIKTYQKGGSLHLDAKDIFINETEDEDDFFITTSNELFEAIKSKGYNVVLQDNEKAFDDGSLSIYLGQKERQYVNVEAQHGHLAEQVKMLNALHDALK